MSWIVETILRRKEQIKTSPDIESDEYNDLLIIEAKIKDLIELGVMTKQEQILLDYLSDGKSMMNAKEDLGKHSDYVYHDISALCKKISFYLGGYFTDEGYISYMKSKYNLTDEELNLMQKYMKNGRYKTKRKPDND